MMKTLSMLSLNLHCLEEKDIKKNQKLIVDFIIDKELDIIYLQEVAQYDDKDTIAGEIKESNYGFELLEQLDVLGFEYHYAYVPIKSSFGKYDEGLGILSKYPIQKVECEYISNTRDYGDWLSRQYLKTEIKIAHKVYDFYCVHTGWDSENESFLEQVRRLHKSIKNKNTFIGGDFNVPVGSEYYEKVLNMGLIDLYGLDEERKYDFSYENELDVHKESARIDYIFSTKKYKVLEQDIVFKDPMVSDHFGVYMKIQL